MLILLRKYIWLAFVFNEAAMAQQDAVSLNVWVNEAMVATYTYTDKNFMERQKDIAHYFTAQAWTAYSKALFSSNLPDMIKKNSYQVSAVATLPPETQAIGTNQWQSSMPLLVLYKNPQYQQKQDLLVTITFTEVPQGQGVRGLAITSLQAVAKAPPCVCASTETTKNTPSK